MLISLIIVFFAFLTDRWLCRVNNDLQPDQRIAYLGLLGASTNFVLVAFWQTTPFFAIIFDDPTTFYLTLVHLVLDPIIAVPMSYVFVALACTILLPCPS